MSKSEYQPALQSKAVLTVVGVAENQRAVIVEAGVEILKLGSAQGNPWADPDVETATYSQSESIS